MYRLARVAGICCVVVLSTAGLQACTHQAPREHVQRASAFITVHNELPSGFQLFFEQSNRRIDAGNIDPLATIRIQLPPDLSYPGSRVVLIAHPLLSGRDLGIPFTANPGAEIRLQIGR